MCPTLLERHQRARDRCSGLAFPFLFFRRRAAGFFSPLQLGLIFLALGGVLGFTIRLSLLGAAGQGTLAITQRKSALLQITNFLFQSGKLLTQRQLRNLCACRGVSHFSQHLLSQQQFVAQVVEFSRCGQTCGLIEYVGVGFVKLVAGAVVAPLVRIDPTRCRDQHVGQLRVGHQELAEVRIRQFGQRRHSAVSQHQPVVRGDGGTLSFLGRCPCSNQLTQSRRTLAVVSVLVLLNDLRQLLFCGQERLCRILQLQLRLAHTLHASNLTGRYHAHDTRHVEIASLIWPDDTAFGINTYALVCSFYFGDLALKCCGVTRNLLDDVCPGFLRVLQLLQCLVACGDSVGKNTVEHLQLVGQTLLGSLKQRLGCSLVSGSGIAQLTTLLLDLCNLLAQRSNSGFQKLQALVQA